MLREFQEKFLQRLFVEKQSPVPDGKVLSGEFAYFGMYVYRSNLQEAYWSAFSDLFPVCLKILKEELFRISLQTCIHKWPTKEPNLYCSCMHFPVVLQQLYAGSNLEFISDIAGIEWQRYQLFHAKQERLLTPAFFAQGSEMAMKAYGLRLASTASVFLTEFPVFAIWDRLSETLEADLGAIADAEVLESAISLQPKQTAILQFRGCEVNQIFALELDDIEKEVIELIQACPTFAQLEQGLATHPQLTAALAKFIQLGVLAQESSD